MRDAPERVPMYKETLQRLKVNWIGLKIGPTYLLGMLEGRMEEEESKKWVEIENNAGLYPQEEETTTESWNVREASKEMKTWA